MIEQIKKQYGFLKLDPKGCNKLFEDPIIAEAITDRLKMSYVPSNKITSPKKGANIRPRIARLLSYSVSQHLLGIVIIAIGLYVGIAIEDHFEDSTAAKLAEQKAALDNRCLEELRNYLKELNIKTQR